MRPTGKRILVLQDTVEVDSVSTNGNGLLIGGDSFKELTEEIGKKSAEHFNPHELDELISKTNRDIQEKKVVQKLNSGVIKYKGAKVDTEEMTIGDRVTFNPHGFTEHVYEGETYLLMSEDAVLLNLTRS